MAGVLTTSSNVTCGHGPGKVSTTSTARLTINGNPVLLKDGIDLKSVSGCGTPLASDASGITATPCLLVSATPTPPTGAAGPPTAGVSAGEAAKLTAGGAAVMLDTLAGKTNGMVGKVSPQLLLAGTAIQNKLTAV